MDLGISGRTAAVAAGSAGLGFGSAKALADDGVKVAICGRDKAKLDRAVAEIGNGCIGIVCDVSTIDGAHEFVAKATSALGHIDILVANGGGPKPGTFASIDIDDYQPALERSMLATVAMCKDVIPAMQARGWGRVVAITSSSVRQPIATLILSNSSRAGLTSFLKTVSREVAKDGVTVNTVQPGSHATDRIRQLYGESLEGAADGVPAGVIGDPMDFGKVVAFLCGEGAKYVTGVNLQVDGGAYGGLI